MPSKHGQFARVLRRGLDCETAALYLGLTIAKFELLVCDGLLPAPKIIARQRLWDKQLLDRAFEVFPIEGDGDPWNIPLRNLPRYVWHYKDRHGDSHYYGRRKGYPPLFFESKPDSLAFWSEYREWLDTHRK